MRLSDCEEIDASQFDCHDVKYEQIIRGPWIIAHMLHASSRW